MSTVTAVVVVLLPISSSSQVPTLVERVQASGGKPITMQVIHEDFPVPLTELTEKSDLAAHVRLIRLRSYMSADQTSVLTDYRIVPIKVLRSRLTNVSVKPGQLPEMVLTIVGGQMSVNGTLVTVKDSKLRPIKDGGQFLLFADRSSSAVNNEDRLIPTGGSAGIFELIDGQRVEPLLKNLDPNREVDGVPFEEVVKRIQAARK